MKKILIILLCAMFILSLTACGKKEESTNNDSSSKTNETNNSSSNSKETNDNITAASYLIDKANKEDLDYQSAKENQRKEMWTFKHEKTEQTDALTDYRYIGSYPNNYVKFNNEEWRIIGVFTVDDGTGKKEQRVKLIKTAKPTIEGEMWDENRAKDWTKSPLNSYLNETFFNELSSESQSMIDNSVWYLGKSISNYYDNTKKETIKATPNAENFYNDERGISTDNGAPVKTIAKIGLMYASDYGFATSGTSSTTRSACINNTLFDYSINEDCYRTDWLYASKNTYELIINAVTRKDYESQDIFMINNFGGIDTMYSNISSTISRPVIYLKSSVKIASGSGVSTDPYQFED